MNTMRHAAAVAALATSAAFLVTGCRGTGDDDGYDITGTVKTRQVEQECKTVQHRPLSGLLAGSKPRPAKPAKPAKPAAPATAAATKAPKVSTSKPPKPTTGGSKWTAPKPVEINPKKLPRHPRVSPSPVRPGTKCKTEYELFIENSDGVFEQDVPAWHYWSCDEGARFDKCTRS